MTNSEKIRKMSDAQMLETFNNLYNTPFKKYVDYEAYMQSEDENILHFVKHTEYAIVRPSEMEMTAKSFYTETEKDIYIMTHTKKMPVLDRTNILGMKYVVLADLKSNIIMKIPEAQITIRSGSVYENQ